MTGIVIDASVTAQVRRASSRSLEVLNTLLLGERKGRINPEQTKAFLDALRVLSPAIDYASLEQVAPYDALYVELAQRSGCPLATLDQPQRQAARALGVHCL